jgi:hypothetical protein
VNGGVVSEQSIRVGLPFQDAVGHVAALDIEWLRDAARSAIPPEVAPAPGVRTGVDVRIGDPHDDGVIWSLPLTWAGGGQGAWRLTGTLSLRPSHARSETHLVVEIRVVEDTSEAESVTALRGDEIADFAGRSLLQRLYWALEALAQAASPTPAVPAAGPVLAEPGPEDYDW